MCPREMAQVRPQTARVFVGMFSGGCGALPCAEMYVPEGNGSGASVPVEIFGVDVGRFPVQNRPGGI